MVRESAKGQTEGMNPGVLVRLTRAKRLRAGWVAALAYLFCILAPTLSFAMSVGQFGPHCLTGADRVHTAVHHHADGMMHDHQAGHARHHSGHIHSADVAHVASHDHAGTYVASHDDVDPVKAPRAMDGACCGFMCVSAAPAELTAMAKPSAPKAVRLFETYRELADNAPARLYRPPIS